MERPEESLCYAIRGGFGQQRRKTLTLHVLHTEVVTLDLPNITELFPLMTLNGYFSEY